MPPKKKGNAPSEAVAKPAQKRRSKLAKEHDISADDEQEIKEIWAMFCQPHDDFQDKVISLADAKRSLVALNAPPKNNAEWSELAEAMDPEASNFVEYETFYAIAAMKMNAREDDPEARGEEVQKAYRLFTRNQDREINISDLRRIAGELKEDVPDAVLRDMIAEATAGSNSIVSLEAFEDVMKRAGVFG